MSVTLIDNVLFKSKFAATLTWTIILANYKYGNSEKPNADLPKFSFEFEFYNKKDPSFLLIQRFPIHYEDSEDVLENGKCVKVSLNDVQRFLDDEKVSEKQVSSKSRSP